MIKGFGARTTALLFAAFALAACVSMPGAPPVPSIETMQAVQNAGLPAMRVGAFLPGADLPGHADRSLPARGGAATPPNGKSFAAHLGETLSTELGAASRLDPASDIEISGFLVESRLNAEKIKIATGSIAARFVVRRGGTVIYDRVLRENGQWESSFLGNTAIPIAIQGYNSLYPKLVRQLLSDPALANALRGG